MEREKFGNQEWRGSNCDKLRGIDDSEKIFLEKDCIMLITRRWDQRPWQNKGGSLNVKHGSSYAILGYVDESDTSKENEQVKG